MGELMLRAHFGEQLMPGTALAEKAHHSGSPCFLSVTNAVFGTRIESRPFVIHPASSESSSAALIQSSASARLGARVPQTSAMVSGVVHIRSPTFRSKRNG